MVPVADGPPHSAKHIGRVIRRMQKIDQHPAARCGADTELPPVLGQGNNLVIDARLVALPRAEALSGLTDYLDRFPERAARLVRVRIFGTDYDIDWNRTCG